MLHKSKHIFIHIFSIVVDLRMRTVPRLYQIKRVQRYLLVFMIHLQSVRCSARVGRLQLNGVLKNNKSIGEYADVEMFVNLSANVASL